MVLISSRSAAIFAGWLMLSPPIAGSAAGGELDAVVGVITDPLKIKAGSDGIKEAVERFGILADRLEHQVNLHAKERLDQVDGILSKMSGNISGLIDRAGATGTVLIDYTFKSLDNTSKAMMRDLQHTAICTSEIIATNVQSKMSETLNNLGVPTVSIFGIPIFRGTWEPGDIKAPKDKFDVIRAKLESDLALVKPDDHPRKIANIYLNISNLASLTLCHAEGNPNTPAYEELMIYDLEYQRRSIFWTGRVNYMEGQSQ